jgi:hypothetical protein
MIFGRAVAAGIVLVIAAGSIASAEQQAYMVDGHDTFRIGGTVASSKTTYHGTQHLRISHAHGATMYEASVAYDKNGDAGVQHEHASYTSTLSAAGDQKDGANADPDYLTVLNQPFAVQLDAATMRDLGHVNRPVPFDFPSPMTGAALHGTLRRLPDALIGGTRVMGIGFEAAGPLHGALPDKPSMSLAGSITMRGTAYYAYETALLLALDATLAIDGNLDAAAQHAPVSIVYARTIRSASIEQTARK